MTFIQDIIDKDNVSLNTAQHLFKCIELYYFIILFFLFNLLKLRFPPSIAHFVV